jgi:metallo-beta-lactamase class B
MVGMLNVLAVLVAALAASGQANTPGNEPADPLRIADGVYYVGASDIASYLITTPAGHILIDAGYESTVPIIQANVEKLGFHLRDIKILLNTQAHFDHSAGFARLKELTGARLMVSEEDAPLIESGGHGDYLFGDRFPFPPARVDVRLKDADTVRLGGVVLTAHLTPGHTKGCTTWTFDASDRGRTYHVVVVGGSTINPGTKVSGMATYPNITRDFTRTYEVLESLPCDIFLGAHAAYFDGAEKAARRRAHPDGPNPFVDPAGYRAHVERAKQRFREQLAAERK